MALVIAAGLSLSACSFLGLGGRTVMDDLADAEPQGSAFNRALFQNYSYLAKSFGEDVEIPEGDTFDQSGSNSMTSNTVGGLAAGYARKALDAAIDKESIIKNVLLGFASEADGPLPPTVAQVAQATTTATSTKAFDALAKAGWKKDAAGTLGLKVKTGTTTLALSLSTANVPELVESARRIETAWTNMGAKVDVRVFEPTDLNQGVIRPRKYDALLFGLVIGKNSDLYPFWHSSQRNDPGLNVALYTNAKADKLLDLMRKATSTEARKDEYAQLKTEVDADTPAIFLWSPDYIYAVPDKLHGVALGEITTPSDRFIGVEKWYVATDRVWNIFARNNKDTISN